MPKLFVQTIWFLLNTCCLARGPGILVYVRQEVPTWLALTKKLGL